MASIFSQLMTSQQVGIGKVVVGKAPDPDKNKTGITVTVTVFFDGTLNNRYNTAARLSRLSGADRYGGAGTSYANFYSNVSILETLNRKKVPTRKEISIYIEGEGTDYIETDPANPKLTDDSLKGYAMGSGDTGIPAKVTKGMNKIRDRINDKKFYKTEKEYIKELKIDVFGFSRGAAAARHFVHRKAELTTWAKQKETAQVTIKFVGLFDTVSSYHDGLSLSPNFKDDVRELGLRIGSNAQKVVHLTAGDEYRVNFASTSIASSIAAGVGYECVLPGAHSDVGGGYAEMETEERKFISPEELERLVREGWYRRGPDPAPNQIGTHVENYESLSEPTITARWTVGRRTIQYHYQLIPLAIMRALALKSGLELDFEDFASEKTRPFEVPAELATTKATMLKLVLDNDRPHRQVITLALNEQTRMLRNRYLHRSAQVGDAANGPQYDKKLLPARDSIAG